MNEKVNQMNIFAFFGEEQGQKSPVTVGVRRESVVEVEIGCEPDDKQLASDQGLPDFASIELDAYSNGQANAAASIATPVKKASTPKKAEEPEEYDRDRLLCYAGHKIPIENRKWKLEDVRKYLEKEVFPELTKERTAMEYDEKTGVIVPIVRGAKKGGDGMLKAFFFNTNDFLANKKPVNILAARDGLYEIRENTIGVFCIKTQVVPDLPVIHEGFQMYLPKIPYQILGSILAFFRSYIGEENNEVMAQVFWSSEREEFFVEIPDQKVSGDLVEADLNIELLSNIDYVQVLQIHSHNVLESYWSRTDNECEVATMIYAVVGNLDRFYPTIRTRVSIGGKYLEIPVGQIFEMPFGQVVPDEWHEKVTVMKRGEA